MEKWLIQSKKADFDRIAKQHNISPIIARIIRNRDVISEEDICMYLNGSIEDMYSPWLFKDMDRAVDIINIKISQGNKIRIICDYDIDGVCSGYILLSALEKLDAIVDVVVPHRIEDGYGINESIIERAHNDQIDTIITCDNGIAAKEAVQYAKSLGMTVIITDHHEVPYEEINGIKVYNLPIADAIINHKQIDCRYPFKELCGASVAYKLVEALFENKGYGKNEVTALLEYAAIATIGDVVDLQGENRIITRYGLELLRKSNNTGLNALISECDIKKERISSYHIGFVIGPCLNASGRLDTARKAIELLRCKDTEKAARVAQDLKRLNDERKDLTQKGTEQACEIAKEYDSDKIFVIYLKECHESVAGIIAGRVREKFNKPVIVITKAEGCVKGSGRSIENYDMFAELTRVKELFIKFGGHKMAAGISLKEENINTLRERLNENCTLTDEDMIAKVWIDTQLPFKYITMNLVEQLKVIEPYGKGNEKPVFAEKNVRLKHLRILGKESNVMRMEFESESGHRMTAVCFNKTQEFLQYIDVKFGKEEINKATRGINNNIILSITFYPDVNSYNDIVTLQLIVDKFC